MYDVTVVPDIDAEIDVDDVEDTDASGELDTDTLELGFAEPETTPVDVPISDFDIDNVVLGVTDPQTVALLVDDTLLV